MSTTRRLFLFLGMTQLPVLQAKGYRLEPLVRADQQFVFELLSHPQVIPFYGVSFYSYAATSEQMDFYEDLLQNETGGWWKIVSGQTGLPVGACGCNNYQSRHEKIEIGYWLHPDFWGRGIMRGILPVMLEAMPSLWKIHRVEAWVEEGNDSSCRLLENCGFSKEGKLRDCEIKNGRYISLYVYAKLLD